MKRLAVISLVTVVSLVLVGCGTAAVTTTTTTLAATTTTTLAAVVHPWGTQFIDASGRLLVTVFAPREDPKPSTLMDPGNRVVYCDVMASNLSGESYRVSLLDFVMYYGDNQRSSLAVSSQGRMFAPVGGVIVPGEFVQGNCAFEIPKGADIVGTQVRWFFGQGGPFIWGNSEATTTS